jgi:hypothetical protein
MISSGYGFQAAAWHLRAPSRPMTTPRKRPAESLRLQHLYARTTHTPSTHAGTRDDFVHGTTFLPRSFGGRAIG